MYGSFYVYYTLFLKGALFFCYFPERGRVWSSGGIGLLGGTYPTRRAKLPQPGRVIVLSYLGTFAVAVGILSGAWPAATATHAGVMNFLVILDLWSLNFFSLLGLISGRVFLWSYYYMDTEKHYGRFLSIVIRFVLSMVILIFMGSLFGAMIGWDGLGVTSFLLVVYYKNRKSLGSGIITALTNRLGDCFFLVILGVAALERVHPNFSYLLVCLILLTSITKRAQIPFSSWLPSAMAAPTPVRALVHSSTLVTAGVYFLIRFNTARFEWLLALGRATILIAGLCACVEIDIKKIVALSTLSQLGVMIVALAAQQKDFCFFHLITHAMFKALLFICVGVGIHTIFGSQDFRSFAGARRVLVWPSSLLLISNLALLGFPFMSGFYRKDLVLESFYSRNMSGLIALFFLVGVGLTTAYRIKIMNLAIYLKKASLPSSLGAGGFRWQIKGPMVTLGGCSILRGALLSFWNKYFCVVVIVRPDKLMPLLFIRLGFLGGGLASNVKLSFLSSMWNLRSLFQKTRSWAAPINKALGHDGGWIETRGGRGGFHLFIAMNIFLYPTIGLAVIWLWFSLL